MLLELDIKGFVNLQKLQRWQLMFSYNQKMFVLQSYQKKNGSHDCGPLVEMVKKQV